MKRSRQQSLAAMLATTFLWSSSPSSSSLQSSPIVSAARPPLPPSRTDADDSVAVASPVISDEGEEYYDYDDEEERILSAMERLFDAAVTAAGSDNDNAAESSNDSPSSGQYDDYHYRYDEEKYGDDNDDGVRRSPASSSSSPHPRSARTAGGIARRSGNGGANAPLRIDNNEKLTERWRRQKQRRRKAKAKAKTKAGAEATDRSPVDGAGTRTGRDLNEATATSPFRYLSLPQQFLRAEAEAAVVVAADDASTTAAGGKTAATAKSIDTAATAASENQPEGNLDSRTATAPQLPTQQNQSPAAATAPASATASAVLSTPQSITPWIRQFLAKCSRGDVLLPVPLDYLLDHFNLAQLPPVVEKVALRAMKERGDEDGLARYYLEQRRQQQQASSGNSTARTSFPIYRQALRLVVQQQQPASANSNGETNVAQGNQQSPASSSSSAKASPTSGQPRSAAATPYYVESAARALYLLVHQRYVLSPRGLDMVRRRFLAGQLRRRHGSSGENDDNSDNVDPLFGQCPRLDCGGMPLLPYGDSDQIMPSNGDREHFLKRYCGKCHEVYYNWESTVDGCAYGSSFAHLFLLTCGTQVFGKWLQVSDGSRNTHSLQQMGTCVPRIFGFQLHPSVYVQLTSPTVAS